MTAVPFTQCCRLLSVDAKTLRQWIKGSNLSLSPHATDARLKCLTIEQVQHLATLHSRSLRPEAARTPEQVSAGLPQPPAEVGGEPLQSLTIEVQLSPCCNCVDLLQSHLALQATVTHLQQQVAALALELLQERTLSYERRLQTLEASEKSTLGPPVFSPSATPEPGCPSPTTRKQADRRRLPHSSLLPLIEYGACGTYVVLSPDKGELLLTPDSPDWFDWLSTLFSFRFLGLQGRLSAYRHKDRSCWMAYRHIHDRKYEHSLGPTASLTIDHLEGMAAKLQSYLPSL